MANKTTPKPSGDNGQQKTKMHVLEEEGKNGIGGRIELSEEIVATIAGHAAREVDGIHALGRSKMLSFGDDPTRGVAAEVGAREAALDMQVVIEHESDIREVARELRQSVAEAVNRMTGRKVVEVNLEVIGIHTPEPTQPMQPKPQPRVQ